MFLMESDELSVLDPNVDFRQVPPIHQKRTIAFINHFIMRTVSFLNKFAETCETRLMEFDNKIENIEASLLILESQLMSVPWLDKKTDEPFRTNPVETGEAETLNLPEVDVDVDSKDIDLPDNKGVKACEDPRYSKFFKMIQVGVPAAAVKLKMETEGFDPNVLDSPNSVAPDSVVDNNVDCI